MEDEITIDGVKYREVKEEFPIVFKGCGYNFEVESDGGIRLVDTTEPKLNSAWLTGSLIALYKAVEKSKEIRGVK